MKHTRKGSSYISYKNSFICIKVFYVSSSEKLFTDILLNGILNPLKVT